MKYVVYKYYNCIGQEEETVVVFPELVDHIAIARGVTGDLDDVVSAGFVSFGEDNEKMKATCYGRSDTLNKQARVEDDSDLVTRMLNYSRF